VDAAGLVPEAQFLFMGGEPDEIARLKARASLASASRRCVFAGKRHPSELHTFLALSDLVASPRLEGENTPFKIYTYLSSGKPLVATRLRTHAQLLDDGLAFLVEPTPEGLAVGIRRALADRGDAAARALRGRQLIEREYSPARYAQKVERAYEAVAAAVGSKPALR
jgi:glycosyltransferase involved in cell wall biosynthesis